MQVKNRYSNGTRAVMIDEAEAEVLVKAKRRRFSAEYKLCVLAEAERCSEPGQIGVLLRGEGLYSSHLAKWRQQRERGALGQQCGRKGEPQTAELKRLQGENERLRKRLERAEHIIEVQKKLAELLGTSLDGTPSNEG